MRDTFALRAIAAQCVQDGQPFAYLRFADLRARLLALKVGAETQAVDAALQRGVEVGGQRGAGISRPDLGATARPGAAANASTLRRRAGTRLLLRMLALAVFGAVRDAGAQRCVRG